MTNPWAKPTATNQPKASISMPSVPDEEFDYLHTRQQPPKRSDYDEDDQEEFAESLDLLDQSNTETPVHNVVLTLQEENWGDSGGDHDPFIRTITPTQMAWLNKVLTGPGLILASDPMMRSIETAPEPTLPASIELVETVWHMGW